MKAVSYIVRRQSKIGSRVEYLGPMVSYPNEAKKDAQRLYMRDWLDHIELIPVSAASEFMKREAAANRAMEKAREANSRHGR